MKPIRTVAFLLLVLTCSFVFAHTWTAKSGHKLEGEFEKLEDGVVHISLSSGKTGKVKLDLLSEADQQFAKEQQGAKDESPFEIGETAPATPQKNRGDKVKTIVVTAEGVDSTFENVKRDAFDKQSEPLSSITSNGTKEQLPEPETSKDKAIQTVTVEGFGSTVQEAEFDALKNAVNKVVGMLISAETIVTDQTVVETIIAGSASYVKEHKILSRHQEEKLWKVEVQATVEQWKLTERLPVNTAEIFTPVTGNKAIDELNKKKAEEARRIANLENEANVICVLADAIRKQNFPFSCLDGVVLQETEPVKFDEGDKITIRTNLAVTFNTEKFDAFHQAIAPVLKAIEIKRDRKTSTPARGVSIPGKIRHVINSPRGVKTDYGQGVTLNSFPESKTLDTILWVNEKRSGDLLSSKWTAYELPRKTSIIFLAYGAVVPVLEVTLYDDKDEEIASKRIGVIDANMMPSCHNFYRNIHTSIPKSDLHRITDPFTVGSVMRTPEYGWNSQHPLTVCRPRDDWRKKYPAVHFLAPICSTYTGRDGGLKEDFVWPAYRQAVDFELTKDQVESLKSVGCKLLAECPDLDEFHENLKDYILKLPE